LCFGYTSFGTDGKVITSGQSGWGYSVIQQADGKLVVAGYTYNGWTGNDFALIRYNSDGSLDTSFGINGKVITIVSSGSNRGYSATAQADGKILVAGYSNGAGNDFALIRYNNDGSLDTSFGTNGIVITPVGVGYSSDIGYSITLQADSKILVAGSAGNDFALIRYNSDGSLDTSFDTDGKVITPMGLGYSVGYSVTVQTDGKIVVAGVNTDGTGSDFALARYNPDGSLDSTFNVVNTLNGLVSYTKNGTAVVLDSTVLIYDAELASHNNFNGASITL
jgi:uncharacterized delta-60 repeat protein